MADLFTTIRNIVIPRLERELNPALLYHNVAHTLDVLQQSEMIAMDEGVTDPHDLLLLKVAALYHDTGFLFKYRGHEEVSCEIARSDLKNYFKPDELDRICGMIMGTKIPQTPHNLLEEIICDADLDYLGRDDFLPVSEYLHSEFITFKIMKDGDIWDRIQINFFESHHYCTPSVFKKRQKKKLEHLDLLKERSRELL